MEWSNKQFKIFLFIIVFTVSFHYFNYLSVDITNTPGLPFGMNNEHAKGPYHEEHIDTNRPSSK